MSSDWRFWSVRSTFEDVIKNYQEQQKAELKSQAAKVHKNIGLKHKNNQGYEEAKLFYEEVTKFKVSAMGGVIDLLPVKDRFGQINGYYKLVVGDWIAYFEVNYLFRYVLAVVAWHKSFPELTPLRRRLMDLLRIIHAQKDDPS